MKLFGKMMSTSPYYKILNILNENKELIESESTTFSGEWIRKRYIFKKPTKIHITLYNNNQQEHDYKDVMELSVIALMNVFTECRVKIMDVSETERLYIFDDTTDIDMRIE